MSVSYRHKLQALLLLLVLLLLSVLVGRTLATFNSQTSTQASFAAASSFYQIETGTYTGNGVNNRAITVGFQPDVVMVKSELANESVIRTSSMPANQSKAMIGTATTAATTNHIKTFTANGFTIGTNASVNTLATNYQWVAFKAQSNKLTVGSYTGNGAAARTITTGYATMGAFVMPAAASQTVFRTTAMNGAYRFDASSVANSVTGFTSAGFTIGNAANTNTNAATYYYVAFKSSSAQIETGTYTGDGVNNRDINTGFQPRWVFVKRGNNNDAIQRSDKYTTANSLTFDATALQSNRITALNATGFRLGTNNQVNQNNQTYWWLGFTD